MRLPKWAVLEFCGRVWTLAKARTGGWPGAEEQSQCSQFQEELKVPILQDAEGADWLRPLQQGSWWASEPGLGVPSTDSELGLGAPVSSPGTRGGLVPCQVSASEEVSCMSEVSKCVQEGIQNWWLVVEILGEDHLPATVLPKVIDTLCSLFFL